MLTLAAVAANKSITLNRLEVQVRRSTEESGSGWQTAYQISLDLGRGLTARERSILLNSAKHCEVHKLLTGALSFEYGLVAADGSSHHPQAT